MPSSYYVTRPVRHSRTVRHVAEGAAGVSLFYMLFVGLFILAGFALYLGVWGAYLIIVLSLRAGLFHWRAEPWYGEMKERTPLALHDLF